MSIQSFLVKQEGQIQYVLLDVVTERGHFFCSLGVGYINNGDLHLSEVGQSALNALADNTGAKKETVHFVEIATKNRATERVPQAFERAEPSDTVFFVCKDSAVYDAVFAQLGFREQPHLGASVQ